MKQHTDETMVTFDKCISFLNGIGIQTLFREVGTDSFLPGFLIENGTIIIDKQALQHPGDILHEAGHIAVVPSADRPGLTEKAIIKRRDREAEEMMAIAWSYAVCMHLVIDPVFVFHEEGYRGGSTYITDSCSRKDYMGQAMLKGLGVTPDQKNTSPDMIKWLRD